MRIPSQAAPISRNVSITPSLDAISPSDLGCSLCMLACDQLDGIAKTLCQIACQETVCN
jgi:hypothetical protein